MRMDPRRSHRSLNAQLRSEDALNVSGRRRETAMGILTGAVAAVGGLVTGFMNFFTNIFLTPPLKATLTHLEEAELKTLSGGGSRNPRYNLTWGLFMLRTVSLCCSTVSPLLPPFSLRH